MAARRTSSTRGASSRPCAAPSWEASCGPAPPVCGAAGDSASVIAVSQPSSHATPSAATAKRRLNSSKQFSVGRNPESCGLPHADESTHSAACATLCQMDCSSGWRAGGSGVSARHAPRAIGSGVIWRSPLRPAGGMACSWRCSSPTHTPATRRCARTSSGAPRHLSGNGTARCSSHVPLRSTPAAEHPNALSRALSHETGSRGRSSPPSRGTAAWIQQGELAGRQCQRSSARGAPGEPRSASCTRASQSSLLVPGLTDSVSGMGCRLPFHSASPAAALARCALMVM
mmetsp:Transcript_24223/g.62099  ORF Transcript_24223/g.62099 Transcript_24223/m.62099 type:complete len:287 (+) Transcript_24223:316-1176(+)